MTRQISREQISGHSNLGSVSDLVHKSSPQWPKGIFVPVDTHVEFVEEVPKVVRHVETAVRVRVRQLLLHDVRHGSDGLNKAHKEKGNDGRTLAADLPRAASIHKRWCSRVHASRSTCTCRLEGLLTPLLRPRPLCRRRRGLSQLCQQSGRFRNCLRSISSKIFTVGFLAKVTLSPPRPSPVEAAVVARGC